MWALYVYTREQNRKNIWGLFLRNLRGKELWYATQQGTPVPRHPLLREKVSPHAGAVPLPKIQRPLCTSPQPGRVLGDQSDISVERTEPCPSKKPWFPPHSFSKQNLSEYSIVLRSRRSNVLLTLIFLPYCPT